MGTELIDVSKDTDELDEKGGIVRHASKDEKKTDYIVNEFLLETNVSECSQTSPNTTESDREDRSVKAHEDDTVSNRRSEESIIPGWYTDVSQLKYITDCMNLGVVPSGCFLRNIRGNELKMNYCSLGAARIRPILNSLRTNATITVLNLTDSNINDESVPDLCHMFKENTTIKDVNLSENQLTSKCAENLCDVLASSTQLERIDLHGNNFDDKSGIYFSELMATSLRMSYLNLAYNNFGEVSVVQFGRALPQATSLEELNLSWNRMGSGNMRPFAKGLAENKYLRCLNMSFNGIGPTKGCREFAMALRGNKTLESLDFSGNRIAAEGAVLLSRGFVSNATLKIFKMSRNPLQTAGCYAILTGILRNTNCKLVELDFQDIEVNQEFRELQDTARIKLPDLAILAGKRTTEKTRALSPKLQSPEASPKQLLQAMGEATNHTLSEMLRPLDPPGDKLVTRQAFLKVIYLYMAKVGIDLTEEQMKRLMQELDPNTEEEIDFRDFEQ